MYIHEIEDWYKFRYDADKLIRPVADVRLLQGKLISKIHGLGLDAVNAASLAEMSENLLKSSEIEGQILNCESVRSSVARRLGLDIAGLNVFDRNIDGMVEVMFDATHNCFRPLTKERLCGWQASLFPSGYSGMYKIEPGKYRSGSMQVVSGAFGREKIHFEASDASRVNDEMKIFLEWANSESQTDEVLKAAIAHFWFITIHPFDDGNGRVARTIADMFLARSDREPRRFYSMSRQIALEKNAYYEALKTAQLGDGEITSWLLWFCECLARAISNSDNLLSRTLSKAKFWQNHSQIILNERQKKMINLLFDDFFGKLTTSKWAKITKTSNDTALRDIKDLVEKDILKKEDAGGRSANYTLRNDIPS